MDLPLDAKVLCKDGVCGRSEYVIINPVLEKVTHLVVRESEGDKTERIVPITAVSDTVDDVIRLNCDKAELADMPAFVQTQFVNEEIPNYRDSRGFGYAMGTMYYWPYVNFEKDVQVPVEELQIPEGELAVERGTSVEATDGKVGRVDELVTSSKSGRITHLVMRKGHLWGEKEIIIPIAAIDKNSADAILLKISKAQVEELPTFPVHRFWS